MHLSNRTEVRAPVEYVFDRLSGFDALEDRLRGYGASVSRDPAGPVRKGTCWTVEFKFRGRQRVSETTLKEFSPNDAMTFDSRVEGITCQTRVKVIGKGEELSEIEVDLELAAKSLTARLLLQSLKLARSRLAQRLDGRVAEFCALIEQDYATHT